jgi:hypothetical protein
MRATNTTVVGGRSVVLAPSVAKPICCNSVAFVGNYYGGCWESLRPKFASLLLKSKSLDLISGMVFGFFLAAAELPSSSPHDAKSTTGRNQPSPACLEPDAPNDATSKRTASTIHRGLKRERRVEFCESVADATRYQKLAVAS